MVYAPKFEQPAPIEEAPGKMDQSDVYTEETKKEFKAALRKEAWKNRRREEEMKRLRELEEENKELKTENELLRSQLGRIKSIEARSYKTSRFNRNKEKGDRIIQRRNRRADIIKRQSYKKRREDKENERW